MAKNKATIYKISTTNTYSKKDNPLEFCVGIFVYAMVLMIASGLFEAFYVENLFYAIVASLILSLLNTTIKPLLIVFTLPLNILTLGIAYPIVNVIILKFCDFLMGNTFNIEGFFAAFFVAVFISFMKILLDNLITKKVGK
jgi:putative membrane protein